MIQKLEKLCCKTDAEMLSRYVFIVNRPKTENETVYYNVDYIHTAIYENKQIKFHYAEWTVKKELKFKKNGAFYVVSPWALTWDDENYYLVAYDAAAGIIKHYRVDKMRDTEIMEADRTGEESFKNFDLAAFAKKTFGMYGGVDAEVTLECRNELAGVVIDRFGHEVWMCPHGEDHFQSQSASGGKLTVLWLDYRHRIRDADCRTGKMYGSSIKSICKVRFRTIWTDKFGVNVRREKKK